VLKTNHKIYITMCTCLAATIPETDLKKTIEKSQKNFSSTIQ